MSGNVYAELANQDDGIVFEMDKTGIRMIDGGLEIRQMTWCAIDQEFKMHRVFVPDFMIDMFVGAIRDTVCVE